MGLGTTSAILVVFLSGNIVICNTDYQCGPNNACGCSTTTTTKVVMDCTSMRVNIRDVCKAVDEYMNGTVNVLLAGENNIGSMSKDDLTGCEGLSKLDIHYNQIQTITLDTFSDFKSLQELDLRGNSLRVYEESFDQTVFPSSLRVLYLGGNLPLNEFNKSPVRFKYPNISNLQSLEVLFMDGFQSDFGTDYRASNVKNLSLSGMTKFTTCDIKVLTNSTFRNFVSLISLDLSLCSIEDIHAGALMNLKHLQNLDLSVNRRLEFSPLRNVAYGLQFTDIVSLNYSKVYTTFGLGTQLLKSDICYFWNTSIKSIAMDSNRIQLVETNAPILIPESLEVGYMNDNRITFGPFLSQSGCFNNIRRAHANYQNSYHSPSAYLRDPTDDDDDRNRSKTSNCPFMDDTFLKSIAKKKGNCAFLRNTDLIQIFKPTFPQKLEIAEFHDSQMSYKFDVSYIIRPANNNMKSADLSGNVLYSFEGEVGPFPKAQYMDLSRNYCRYIGPKLFNKSPTLQNLQLQENYLGEFFANIKNDAVFKALTHLKVLNLTANRISKLYSSTFAPLVNLTTLDLSSNNIERFEINLNPLKCLLRLNLSVNFIRTLPLELRRTLSHNADRLNTRFAIDLRNNAIDFRCENEEFLEWLVEHRSNMIGFNNYIFSDGESTFPGSKLEARITSLRKKCRSYTLPIVLGAMGVSIFLSILIGGVIYKYRWKIRYFMYMSKFRYFGYKRLDDDIVVENFKHDAFISYADDDIRFVRDEVIPNLEDERGLTLCVHQRDFLPGNDITDNIIGAIQESRKTVVILSKRFLKKKWCMYEFNMARMESIYSRAENGCLVLVMLENVPTKDIPLEMLEWIQSNSYIEYTKDEQGEIVFWDKLKDAISVN